MAEKCSNENLMIIFGGREDEDERRQENGQT